MALAACAFAVMAWAQHPTVEELETVGLPWVEVTTVGGEEPTCDYLSPPPYATGHGITNATKVPGRLRIIDSRECVYDSGDFDGEDGGMTIKIRGNSSAYQAKKPYKVRLRRKADLLRRGDDETYQDRDWLLMKEDMDVGGNKLLYMMIGLEVARLCGVAWEPQARFVNLTVNGDYRGVYMLCESVKRNPGCRIDVDKETGYIVEFDPYWWNEDVYFTTERHGKAYTFKYPDPDEVTGEQVAYIKDVLDQLEDALWDGSYPALIDVGSMAAWLMAHDILGTYDAFGSNIFLTKHDDTDGSRLAMGPLWDFDSIFWTEDAWARIHDQASFYFYYLLCLTPVRSVPLADAYLRCWEEAGRYVGWKMTEFLHSFSLSGEAAALQVSNVWDQARWWHGGPTVDEMVWEAVAWFAKREAWMEARVTTLGMGTPAPTATPRRQTPAATYDILGRRVPRNYRGAVLPDIHIQGEKKHVLRR